MNKKAILVVSFGTSYRETREKTLNVIEEDMRNAFERYEFRRAYTSPTIMRILKNRDGIQIDNVTEALERLAKDGFEVVIVQPTHVICGLEYDAMKATLAAFSHRFKKLVCGMPLLTFPEDYERSASVLARELLAYRKPQTDVILMGHGTEHVANAVYKQLEQVFWKQGCSDFLVGTVEASPTLEHMLETVKNRDTTQVILTPFMVVAGDHAVNDMAGEDGHSWKSQFERDGYDVVCVMKGLGEYPEIRAIFVEHAKKAEENVTG